MTAPDAQTALLELEETVMKNLHKNGFPEKAVAFPIDSLYEAAAAKGFSFNKVRDRLEEQGVSVSLEDKRIVFSAASRTESVQRGSKGIDPESASGSAADDTLANMAASVLGKLSSTQMAEMRKAVESIDPSQLTAMRSKLENMSEEERAQLLSQMSDFLGGGK